MLNDFLMLELYFGSVESAQFIEDAARKYGWSAINNALQEGLLNARTIMLGPETGRTLCWLSSSGRAHAETSI